MKIWCSLLLPVSYRFNPLLYHKIFFIIGSGASRLALKISDLQISTSSMQKTDTALLQTKPHFGILDGLRGIAALAVVLFHFMEIVFTDYSKNFIGHGFLAVDFFFCLSGFVIGYAYDNRIEKMGVRTFFTSRLIRLHPLVIFGSVLGLAGFLFDPFGGQPALYSTAKLALIFLTSILLIPFGVMEDRFFNLFGLNAPAWSLFWEYVANILYAFILCRLARRYLIGLSVIAAFFVCLVAYRSGSLLGGWSKDNFWDGGARIAYSFLEGLIVYRCNWILKNKLGFTGLAFLLAIAFISPYSQWNWITEPFIVLLYFPFLIALGAGTKLNGSISKLCVFSGKISYPLYMTHYAGIWIFASYCNAHKPGMLQLAIVIISGILLLMGFAYAVMRLYDIPVRKYLSERRNKL